jgi:fluoride exporter
MARLLLLIALGGAIGSVARFLLSLWVQPVRPGLPLTHFPVGTLVVNVTGCLAIGVLHALFYGSPHAANERPELRAFLIVGVLGGYTTFSSFGRETLNLIGDNQLGAAAAYVLLSNALGLIAVWLGMRAGGYVPGM